MTDLQLTRVVLYKIGVGFFEKKGKVKLPAEKAVELLFKNTNMNDLLKTFAIFRVNGDAIVTGVSYPGQDTNQSKMLQDSLIKLPDENTFHSLLSQLRGVEVLIGLAGQDTKGTIVGTQTRVESVSNKSPAIIEEVYLILKKPEGTIKHIRVKEIERLKILDPLVHNDFKFFIDVIKSSKGDKTRNVVIYFDGKTESEFVINALQEFPSWKCSYRLFMFKEEEPAKESQTAKPSQSVQIILQSWAIIDNVLNEDWEKIRLTLVSGLPISFNYDSYSPLWISRPTIERAQKLEVNVNQIPSIGGKFIEEPGPTSKETQAGDIHSLVNSIMTKTDAKGSGFEYKIPMPVNVKRNQSSLIPLLQSKLSANLVSVYNENVDKIRPMRTLEFKNETNFVLETGPISIFNENIFEGEAVLPFMEKDEQQRIPYSVDQGIEVHKKIDSETLEIHEIQTGSTLYCYRWIDKTTVYKIKNIAEESKILIVEHAKESDFKLYKPEKADEESRNYYRFRIELGPSEAKDFELKERRKITEYKEFDYVNRAILESWMKMKLITQKIYDELLKYIELVERRTQCYTEINQINERKNSISQEQARIRQNMDVLGTTNSEKSLQSRYVKKFDVTESEIDEMDEKITKLQAEISKIEAEMQKMRYDGI